MEQKITLTLPVSTVNLILEALQVQPYKIVAGAVTEITSQAQAQLEESPAL